MKWVEQLFLKAWLNAFLTEELQHYPWGGNNSGFCTTTTNWPNVGRTMFMTSMEMWPWLHHLNFSLGAGCADGTRLLQFVEYQYFKHFYGVCLCVCHRWDALPIWGRISACILSATATLPDFHAIASAINEY